MHNIQDIKQLIIKPGFLMDKKFALFPSAYRAMDFYRRFTTGLIFKNFWDKDHYLEQMGKMLLTESGKRFELDINNLFEFFVFDQGNKTNPPGILISHPGIFSKVIHKEDLLKDRYLDSEIMLVGQKLFNKTTKIPDSKPQSGLSFSQTKGFFPSLKNQVPFSSQEDTDISHISFPRWIKKSGPKKTDNFDTATSYDNSSKGKAFLLFKAHKYVFDSLEMDFPSLINQVPFLSIKDSVVSSTSFPHTIKKGSLKKMGDSDIDTSDDYSIKDEAFPSIKAHNDASNNLEKAFPSVIKPVPLSSIKDSIISPRLFPHTIKKGGVKKTSDSPALEDASNNLEKALPSIKIQNDFSNRLENAFPSFINQVPFSCIKDSIISSIFFPHSIRKSSTKKTNDSPAFNDGSNGMENEWSLLILQSEGTSLGIIPSLLMERFFPDYDLKNIRIHNDNAADQAAGALGAKAFSLGKDIFFRAGSFNPSSVRGLALLGHELVHSQQIEYGAGIPSYSNQEELERDAVDAEISLINILPERFQWLDQKKTFPDRGYDSSLSPVSMDLAPPIPASSPYSGSNLNGSGSQGMTPGAMFGDMPAHPLKAEEGIENSAEIRKAEGSVSNQQGAGDIEGLSHQIYRYISRQITIEKERMGIDRWDH